MKPLARINTRKYKENSSLYNGRSPILYKKQKQPIFNIKGWICGILLKVPIEVSEMFLSQLPWSQVVHIELWFSTKEIPGIWGSPADWEKLVPT